MPRMSVDFPQNISEKLEVMAKEVGMTKTALVNMAVATMVTKFDEVGMRIFFDLLTPGVNVNIKRTKNANIFCAT